MYEIVIYTDGACSGNPGPAGIGAVLMCAHHYHEIGKHIGKGTNNIAELSAVKYALKNIYNFELPITIYTDSMYVINVLTGKWKGTTNIELLQEIKDLMKNFNSIKFKHVKGHSGNKYNERADALAVLNRDG